MFFWLINSQLAYSMKKKISQKKFHKQFLKSYGKIVKGCNELHLNYFQFLKGNFWKIMHVKEQHAKVFLKAWNAIMQKNDNIYLGIPVSSIYMVGGRGEHMRRNYFTCDSTCAAIILKIALTLALQMFYQFWAQLKYCRSGMIISQSNVIKVKKETFMRYISVARIFD